jgi:hypothetical protein
VDGHRGSRPDEVRKDCQTWKGNQLDARVLGERSLVLTDRTNFNADMFSILILYVDGV